MKNQFRVLLLLISIVFCQSLYAQSRDSIYMSATCDSIIKGFVDGDYPAAMNFLKTNSILGNKVDQIKTTITDEMSKAETAYGKTTAYQFILERDAGGVVKKRFYFLLFEKFFVKFDFTWYKTATGWKIVNFNFDENVAEVLN